ncbi:hypothetical protein PIB30_022937 [Stylosanthes scabra]|uniref:TF-B3 domain-containing protein n=1 Tax=Stylosanthes scabra TaxID=79078 RepID=A0ABU6R9K1_9FABA|nr:hypothetical protein [Stylosanthes scabra]
MADDSRPLQFAKHKITLMAQSSAAKTMYVPAAFRDELKPFGTNRVWSIFCPCEDLPAEFSFRFKRGTQYSDSFIFAGEWRRFCTHFNLGRNDVCVFKIMSPELNLLKVVIERNNA